MLLAKRSLVYILNNEPYADLPAQKDELEHFNELRLFQLQATYSSLCF